LARSRNIHFVSLGCAKNRVDTEVMLGVAEQLGYRHVAEPERAQVVVVNTCGFIDDAKKESIGVILEMAALKASGKLRTLVVAGCLSQGNKDALSTELPEVDYLLGSSDALRLKDVLTGRAERLSVGNPADWLMNAEVPRRLTTPGNTAFVKLSEGCDRSCAFCVIPKLRGRLRSRSMEDVFREAERLAEAGVRELCLISQDTLAYGRDRSDGAKLVPLLERLGKISSLQWIRLHYLYPERFPAGLIELLAEHPKILPYLDMPLQHSHDNMLRRMRRGHTELRMRRTLEELRTRIPELTLRTAFIVGHPGETEFEFEHLLDFVRWARFEHVGAFRYSDEAGTASHTQTEKVPARTAMTRLRKLLRVQRPIARAHLRALLGKRLPVLVERPSEESELVMVGRHAGQAPEVDGVVVLSGPVPPPGSFVSATITQVTDYDLKGEVSEQDAEAVAISTPPRQKRRLPLAGR